MSQATQPPRRNSQSIGKEIIDAIAEAEGVPTTDLEACLYDVVDPDALNKLFQDGEDGPATDGIVSFTFHGYRVTVHSDSSVEVD